MALEICGDQAIFMPEEQCDSCEQFMSDIQRLDRAVANTYTKAEVDALIADVEHVHLVEVDVLPATGEDNIIYLVPRTGGTGKEVWIYSNSVWHDLGPTTIDLSNYYTKSEVDARFNQSDANLAPIETNPASAAHAVGDWIMYNGSLYSVTAAIAQGDALTVGGNVAAANVGTELRADHWGSTLGLQAYKINNFVIAQLSSWQSADSIANITLPVRFRPKNRAVNGAVVKQSNLSQMSYVALGLDGTFRIVGDTTSSYFFTMVYPVYN